MPQVVVGGKLAVPRGELKDPGGEVGSDDSLGRQVVHEPLAVRLVRAQRQAFSQEPVRAASSITRNGSVRVWNSDPVSPPMPW